MTRETEPCQEKRAGLIDDEDRQRNAIEKAPYYPGPIICEVGLKAVRRISRGCFY